MIISPPFLPTRAANQVESAWLDAAFGLPAILPPTQAPEGSFPLGNHLAWHNGLHIQGQANAEGHTLVRAIADGEVLFVSPPTRANADVNDPLNYNPFGQGARWTDNGIVIVRHTTEIGAHGNQPTEIVYFSVYMHLNQIGRITPAGQTAARALQVGDRIWRKDEIGRVGQVYGHTGQVHLEIALDEANLTRLIGRAPAWVDPANIPAPTADGRIDAVFGAIWFYLPASTPTQAAAPTTHLRAASQTTLGEAVWVKMYYDGGSCTFTTFNNQGRPIGNARSENEGEYNLYNTANTRHNALPPVDRNRSSPSGWYELLRFGRNLGRGPNAADKDPLPANAAHWRQITGPNGQAVWADLNAEGSFKFSDADFLPIQGWCFINDDSAPNDQRCDSNHLKNLIADPDSNAAGRMEMANLLRRLGNPEVMQKLRRVVCQFPSEWDQGTIAARYGFVRELPAFQEAPEGWAPFEAHLRALSFASLPADYTAATWRFHPRMFIELMRGCGWLSLREFKQLLPSHAIRTGRYRDANGQRHSGTFWEAIRTDLDSRQAALRPHRIPLNKTLRKYGLNSPQRMVSFFGNAVQESSWLSSFAEGGGSEAWYAPWYGRGFLQLTHPENYITYWRWRGRQIPETLKTTLDTASRAAHRARNNATLQDIHFPALTQEMRNWREDVEGDPDNPRADKYLSPSDSAGQYAIASHGARTLIQYADEPHVLERRVVVTVDSQGRPQGNRTYYRSQAFWQVSAAVNLPGAADRRDFQGLNGFDSRCCAYGVAIAVLTEMKFPDARGGATLDYPEGYTPRKA